MSTYDDPAPAIEGETRLFQLSDGRQYAYRDVGDQSAPVLVYLHGLPGCRLDMKNESRIAVEAGLRVVKVDRPGFGLSSPLASPPRTIPEYALDLRELLDQLGIQRFAVAGVSGGGPHVMGAVHALPDRVAVGFILSGVSDLQAPSAKRGMMFANRAASFLATYAPALFQLSARTLGSALLKPDTLIRMLELQMAQEDLDSLVGSVASRDATRKYFAEALRQGAEAFMQETALLFGGQFPWGVDLSRLSRVPLYWWQGDQDRNVPSQHAWIFKERVPHTVVRVFDEEGHDSYIFKYGHEMMQIIAQHLAARAE